MPYKEVLTGVAVFAVFVTLLVWTILNRRPVPPPPGGIWVVKVDVVSGLRKGDEVWVSGFAVGRVGRIDLVPGDVRVHLYMRQPIEFHEGYSVLLKPLSFFGGTFVDLDLGDLDAPRIPRGTLLAGEVASLPSAGTRAFYEKAAREASEVWRNALEIRRAWREEHGALARAASNGTAAEGADLRASVTDLRAHWDGLRQHMEQRQGSLERFFQEFSSERWTRLGDEAGKIRDACVNGTGSLPWGTDDELIRRSRLAFEQINDLRDTGERVAALPGQEQGSYHLFRYDHLLYDRVEELKHAFAGLREHYESRRGSALRLAYDTELRKRGGRISGLVETAYAFYGRYYFDTFIFGKALQSSGIGDTSPSPLQQAAGQK